MKTLTIEFISHPRMGKFKSLCSLGYTIELKDLVEHVTSLFKCVSKCVLSAFLLIKCLSQDGPS